MPNRAKSFASALFGGVLAGGVLAAGAPFGLNATAFAASDCIESPDQRTTEPGHWYYHFDRTLGRRCWFFQPSEARSSDVRSSGATASPQPAAAPAAAPDSQQSLLSRFAAGFSQPFTAPPQQAVPQQASIPEDPGDAAKAGSPKSPRASKASRRDKERPEIAPLPTTSGASTDRQQDQSQQPAADKDEKRAAPVNVADRESLFQDFMKWQRDRTVFGFSGRW
jgi:hypothetical protein